MIYLTFYLIILGFLSSGGNGPRSSSACSNAYSSTSGATPTNSSMVSKQVRVERGSENGAWRCCASLQPQLFIDPLPFSKVTDLLKGKSKSMIFCLELLLKPL